MTQPLPPNEPFALHARLAELVNTLRFQRYQLFVAGLVYEQDVDAGVQPSADQNLLLVAPGECARRTGRGRWAGRGRWVAVRH